MEDSFARFTPRLMQQQTNGSVTVAKYLQSYRYFERISSVIRSEFRFSPNVSDEVNDIFLKLLQNISTNVIFIGVHVRRGDMLNSKLQDIG